MAKKPSEAPMMSPGVRVKYTAKFIRNTGQTGSSACRQVFTIRPCGCRNCTAGIWVCTTQMAMWPDGMYSPEEIDANPGYEYLHIDRTNLQIVKSRRVPRLA